MKACQLVQGTTSLQVGPYSTTVSWWQNITNLKTSTGNHTGLISILWYPISNSNIYHVVVCKHVQNGQNTYSTNTVNPSDISVQFSQSKHFVGFFVTPIHFDFVYVFTISQYSSALFMSLRHARHDISIYLSQEFAVVHWLCDALGSIIPRV